MFTIIFFTVILSVLRLTSSNDYDLGDVFTKNTIFSNDYHNSQLISHDRQKRQVLVFPKSTVLQVSFCVASPLQLKDYNIYINQGFQLNFVLPKKVSEIPSTFLLVPPVINARSREKRAEFDSSIMSLTDENSLLDLNDITTEHVYILIESFLTSKGYNGSGCLMHSICQLAAVPLHQDDDLIHDVLHFILTPSEHGNLDEKLGKETSESEGAHHHQGGHYSITKNPTTLAQYLEAEHHGKNDDDCDLLYQDCPLSPLDGITNIVDVDDEHENSR